MPRVAVVNKQSLEVLNALEGCKLKSEDHSESDLLNPRKVEDTVNIVANINGASIYTTLLINSLSTFYNTIGKYFFFSLGIPLRLIKTMLAWRHAKLEKYQHHALEKAIIESAFFSAATVGVIGGLTATAGFVLASPLIFTVMPAIEAVYDAIYAGIYLKNANNTQLNDEDRKKNKEKAINSVISASNAALTAGIVGTVFVVGYVPAAIAGATLVISNIGLTLYRIQKEKNNLDRMTLEDQGGQEKSELESAIASTAIINKKLDSTVKPVKPVKPVEKSRCDSHGKKKISRPCHMRLMPVSQQKKGDVEMAGMFSRKKHKHKIKLHPISGHVSKKDKHARSNNIT